MIANAGHDERGKYHGGKAGDQTGSEYCVRSWYPRPWSGVLRAKRADVREVIADVGEKGAKNKNVGYDQYQRLTLHNENAKVGWHPEKITTPCETDCTASAMDAAVAAGHRCNVDSLKSIPTNTYSGNIVKNFLATGEFEWLTDSKYRTSDQYLLRGDILVYENHHAAINLDNGSKASSGGSSSSSKPATKPKPASKPKSNKIDPDGEWGPATTTAAQKVFGTPIDGIVSRQIAKYKKYMPACLSSSWKFLDSGYKGGSQLIKAIQKWIGVAQDGLCGPGTIKALQKKLGFTEKKVDGVMGPATVTAFQKYLNKYL